MGFQEEKIPIWVPQEIQGRFCVRGDQQIEGVDVFETYAPVVSWTVVLLLLVISIILQLKIQQVDYVNSFCQVPLEQSVFVELPGGA